MSSKRYKKLPEKTKYLPSEVIKNLIPKLKQNCTSKFDESLDLSIQINNKQKKSEINLRTIVNLPAGSGKKIKVAVVCEEAKSPLEIISSISLPISDLFLISALRRSPVEIWWRLNFFTIFCACVPFPAPGGPKITTFT